MTDDRDFVDQFIDAGSSFDWITPTYGAVRDLLVDGKTFTVDAGTWHGMQPLLAKQGIEPWAVSIYYQNGAYWYVFSVDAAAAPAVERFTGYRRTGGRGKAMEVHCEMGNHRSNYRRCPVCMVADSCLK
jgi:hypothetical protein